MDNYLLDMSFVDALIGFCGAVVTLLAVIGIGVLGTEWLQHKLDELNDEVDEQLNETEQ